MKALCPALLIIFCATAIPLLVHGQCKGLTSSEIKKLARSNFPKKLKILRDNQAKTMAVKADSLQCEYRTLALCKNYISDAKWHWAEILTFNSCDQIVTYSTSDSLHYHQVVTQLTKRSSLIGERTTITLDMRSTSCQIRGYWS